MTDCTSLNLSNQFDTETKPVNFMRVKSIYDNLVDVDPTSNKYPNENTHPASSKHQSAAKNEQLSNGFYSNPREYKFRSPRPASKRVSLNSLLTECAEYINQGNIGSNDMTKSKNGAKDYYHYQNNINEIPIQQGIYSIPRKTGPAKNSYPFYHEVDLNTNNQNCLDDGELNNTLLPGISDIKQVEPPQDTLKINGEAFKSENVSVSINQQSSKVDIQNTVENCRIDLKQLEKHEIPEVQTMDKKKDCNDFNKYTMLSWPDVIPSPIRDVDSTKKDIEQTILNTSTTQQLPQFNAPSIKGNKQTTSVSKVQNWIKVNEQHHQEQEKCKKIFICLNYTT